MSDPFVIAVPSKGRMQESAMAFFARAGLKLVRSRGARDYRGTLEGFSGTEVAFLPVTDIVTQIAEGQAHFGVAGEDLLREQVHDADARAVLLSALGFGHANVVVAVPQAWIDVRTMADLEDVAAIFHARKGRRMRVATKYLNLTRRFFAAKGVTDYRIVESYGATEGEPAAGSAELIVDITTTGATLAANGLKVLDDGVILRSEANLMASLTAPWSEQVRESARAVLGRIAAEEKARTSREVRAHFGQAPSAAPDEAARLFGAEAFPSSVDSLAIYHAPAEAVAPFADWLTAQGASSVAVAPLDYLFAARNTLYDALVSRLSGKAAASRTAAIPARI